MDYYNEHIYIGSITDNVHILDSEYESVETLKLNSGIIDINIENGKMALNSFTNQI